MLAFLDIIFSLLSAADDLQHAKRYGCGSLLWKLVAFLCMAVTVLCFVWSLNILGVVGVVVTIAALVCMARSIWKEIKDTREKEKDYAETEQ